VLLLWPSLEASKAPSFPEFVALKQTPVRGKLFIFTRFAEEMEKDYQVV
jgi:hypothetical protein